MPGRNKFAFLSIQRRIIDCKNHTHCRFIHFNPLESLRSDKISKCIPYFEILKTNNCTEVTTSDTISFSSPKSFKYIKFLDSYLLDLSIPFAQSIIQSGGNVTPENTSDCNSSNIAGKIE